MKHYVFPDKIQRMVKLLYEIFECAVLDERNQSNWFGITTGVGQGFVMSGFYFYYLVMQCYDIPDKIQRMVKLLYETFECTVLDGINQNNHWWETNLCYVRSSISTIYRIQGKKKNPQLVTRITRLMPHLKQDIPTLPEPMSSPSVFSGVRIAWSSVFYVMFCRSLLMASD